MDFAVRKAGASHGATWSWAPLLSPWTLFLASLVLVGLLLSLPLVLPIGPMYWDVYIYYDAANRILDGQVPSVDFFAPVGPLGYYLFTGWLKLFPDAQPTLLAHWSLLAVTAPLMAAVVWDVDRRDRAAAYALLIPFLIFALLPFNTRDVYPFPGSDGFGIYNCQVCQVLYVLVAALFFVRDRKLLATVLTVAMLALFMLKITGFVAGGVIAAYAVLAGRLRLSTAIWCAMAFLAGLGGLEVATGVVSAYLTDIIALVKLNSDTLGPRFLQAASMNFGVVAPAAALAALLIWLDGRSLWLTAKGAVSRRSFEQASSVFNHDGFWLLVVLFAGILFETQNTGSQALILLWPVLFLVFRGTKVLKGRPKLLLAVTALVAASAFPTAITVIERAARAYVGAVNNTALENRNLKTLGAVSMRPEVSRRLGDMLAYYPGHRVALDDLIPSSELPSPLLYSDFDFQTLYLTAVDQTIDSIRSLEAKKHVRFETMMSLNFVNPFPWLMDRSAPRFIAIGADPARAVPAPGEREEQAVSETDLVLYPTCPTTIANAMLYKMYAPALAGHTRIRIDPCYDAFVHPKFAKALQ